MVSRHNSQTFEGWLRCVDFGDDSSGNRAGSPHRLRGRKIMKVGTRRTVIAGAALVAAGIFGSLPWDGSSSLAQQGVPVEHHNVALVDSISDTAIGSETAIDNFLYAGVFGPTGAESELFNGAVTLLGGSAADALLGTTALAGADGIFDGAASSFSSGIFLDTWAAEDHLNQLLGITATTSETAILADIAHDPITLAVGDVLPTAGAPGFDADLMSFANADFSAGTTEFTTYLDSLPALVGDLGGLSGLLGDLGSLGSLGTELTSLLDGLLGSL
jgi:hypothetical protein